MSLIQYSPVIGFALFVITCFLLTYFAAKRHPDFSNSLQGAIIQLFAYGLIVLVISDVFLSSGAAIEKMQPLKKEFRAIAYYDSDSLYREEMQQRILKERDAMAKRMALDPLLVQWEIKGNSAATYTRYMHYNFAIGMLLVWALDILLLYYGGFPSLKERRRVHVTAD